MNKVFKGIFLCTFLALLPIYGITAPLSYLRPDSIDLASFPPPPILNSDEELLDFTTVLQFQQVRSLEDCARAASEEDGLATSFFGPPLGPLTKEEAEAFVAFQETLFKELNFFNRHLKDRWKRLRPYQADTRVQSCIDHSHPSSSYPSGHSAIAIIAAKSLALLYPERTGALLERAQAIALGRVIGGVHYPSDISAGLKLGNEIFEALLQEESFISDLSNQKPRVIRIGR